MSEGRGFHRGLQWGLCILVVMLGAAGCGGSSSSSSSTPSSNTTEVAGAAVKGPLANADVVIYQLDPEADDLKGNEVGSGHTSDQAAITANLNNGAEGLLLVEVLAGDNTTDLTTGNAPVLSRLTTVTDAEAWREGRPVYATSLTHMAVGVATRNVGDNVESALARAQKAVRNTFGLALLGEDLDLFTSAPLLRAEAEITDTPERVLRYRKAAEVAVAIVAAIQDLSTNDPSPSIEEVFAELVADLASGEINGEDSTGQPVELGVDDIALALENLDPEELEIPGADGKKVSDVREVVNDEREAVGAGEEEEIGVEDDEPAQKASADSGLVSLVGANVKITLEVSPADAGAGALSANGETGGETGEVTVGADATVSLLAEAEEGFEFWEWVDDLGQNVAWRAEDEFSTDENMTLVGVFYPLLSLEADPVEGGIPATTSGFDAQEAGSMVTVNADPALGFGFMEWRDAQGHRSLDESYTFEMPAAPLELTAVYELNNATVNEEGWGDISVSGTFEEGEQVTYTAEPATGYQFVEWVDGGTGTPVSTDASYTFELSQDTDLIAVFEPVDGSSEAAVWDEFNWDEADWQ